MLELRPNCELCDRDLPPQAKEARICTYECTYCAECVETVLQNVCPNCGGNFVPRPIRPARGLEKHPARKTRVHSPFTLEKIRNLCEPLRDIAPADR